MQIHLHQICTALNATALWLDSVACDGSCGFGVLSLELEFLLEYGIWYAITNPQDYRNTKYISQIWIIQPFECLNQNLWSWQTFWYKNWTNHIKSKQFFNDLRFDNCFNIFSLAEIAKETMSTVH